MTEIESTDAAYDRAAKTMNQMCRIPTIGSATTQDGGNLAERAQAYALIAICERLHDISEALTSICEMMHEDRNK